VQRLVIKYPQRVFQMLCTILSIFETWPIQVEILRQRPVPAPVLGPFLDNGPFLFENMPFWNPKTGLYKKDAAPETSAGSATSPFSWRPFVSQKLQKKFPYFGTFRLWRKNRGVKF